MAADNFWNEDKVAELKRLWVDEKLSGSQIAAALGLKDRNAVMGKIHRLGITRKIAAADGEATPSTDRKPGGEAEAVPDAPASLTVSEAAPSIPAAPPSPPEAPEPDAIDGHPVMRLKESSCRWPLGDPQKPDFRFCCADRLGAYPYCAEHAAMSYLPPERQSRRVPAPAKAA